MQNIDRYDQKIWLDMIKNVTRYDQMQYPHHTKLNQRTSKRYLQH